MDDYPIVPGRGLVTDEATALRHAWLQKLGIDATAIAQTQLPADQLRHNIESLIGTVEIPVGLAGPLLFNHDQQQEMVYAPAGTLEGALLASMNRGAKAVSLSGGFSAAVIHQKMIRSPLFVFQNLAESVQFKAWIDRHFDPIKQVAEQYSNHAQLQVILPYITGKGVHLKFVYTTGDASGQNMTTTCTWHAVLWIREKFTAETGIEPVHFVIEGNGASDKKVSHFSMLHGRGIHVIAECELDEHIIERVLRTNSTDFMHCIHQSMVMGQLDGMVGYNINVANAVAAIFVATGQDLASIHESGTGVLNLEKTDRGLYFSLSLPSLVIGTIGGGTHLPKQKEALGIMGCAGNGKVFRFAQLIAGFALGLEISTFAAIVGGQFAKAHEKLGRNKPVNWLTRSEINPALLQSCMNGHLGQRAITAVHFPEKKLLENGIIVGLTARINKKFTGFCPIDIDLKDANNPDNNHIERLLVKSKPLDEEVIKGLHLMASAISPALADLISQYQDVLEYKNCHQKEILLYELLTQSGLHCMPTYYGQKIDISREIYLFLQEWLCYDELLVINAENDPGRWTPAHICTALKTISEVHRQFEKDNHSDIPVFEPWKALPLYQKMAENVIDDFDNSPLQPLAHHLLDFVAVLETVHGQLTTPKTIIHNDFNARNVAVRKDGSVCIYDWELSVKDFPQRDIVEFLSFVLPDNFEPGQFERYLNYAYSLYSPQQTREEWNNTCLYSLKAYLVTRVSFYLTGKNVLDFKFADRIFGNAMRMIAVLEAWD
jgi:hydroxymethylglutaryl-CoA reductase (NADPH)